MVAEHKVASVAAIQNFGSFVFASFAPIVTGWVVDTTHSFNLALVIAASAVCMIIGIPLGILAARRKWIYAGNARRFVNSRPAGTRGRHVLLLPLPALSCHCGDCSHVPCALSGEIFLYGS